MCARKLFFVFLPLILLSFAAHAREITVFSVNKNLQMSPKDPIFKDYYINGGMDDGLRKGMVVTVIRRTPVHDLSRNKALGDIHLPVAKVKLIYVQKTLSIGRIHTLIQSGNIPSPDYASVMVGDKISFTDGTDGYGVDPGELESIKTSDDPDDGKGVAPTPESKPSELPPKKTSEVAPPEPKAEPAKAESAKVEGNAEDKDAKVESPRKPSSEAKPKASLNSEKEKKPLKSDAKPDTNSPSVGPAA